MNNLFFGTFVKHEIKPVLAFKLDRTDSSPINISFINRYNVYSPERVGELTNVTSSDMSLFDAMNALEKTSNDHIEKVVLGTKMETMRHLEKEPSLATTMISNRQGITSIHVPSHSVSTEQVRFHHDYTEEDKVKNIHSKNILPYLLRDISLKPNNVFF